MLLSHHVEEAQAADTVLLDSAWLRSWLHLASDWRLCRATENVHCIDIDEIEISQYRQC